jgi:hypothetical protein
MKNQTFSYEGKDEFEILSEQLNSEEMQVLGYIKGFDRKTLKAWNKKGLMDFTVSNT